MDPMADRKMTANEARSLLREAVTLNIQSRGRNNRFSEERDEIVANLTTARQPANYSDYSHPSEV